MKLYIDSIKDRRFGYIYFAVSDRGLRCVSFGKYSGLSQILEHACKYNLTTSKNLQMTKDIKKQLREFFQGKKKSFKLNLDIGYMPAFKQKVLKECKKISYDKTTTYGYLAKKAGSPKAARAVGQIMAANPIPIVIPCHRVVGSGGHLTGYGGGLDMKKRLLAMEGVEIKRERVVE